MKEVLPRLSLAGNLEKPLMSLYGTESRDVAMDSVKNQRKIRTECLVWGGGGGGHNTFYLDDGLKILQNN
jgi:hypothetical protein